MTLLQLQIEREQNQSRIKNFVQATMNSTTTSEHPLLYMRPLGQPLLSFALLFLPLIIVATTVGNSLVIRAIFTEKCLQHVQNYPLASLAVADLLTALLVMSQGVVYEVLQYWPLNKTLCYMWIVMDVFLCTASILNMCLIGNFFKYSIYQISPFLLAHRKLHIFNFRESFECSNLLLP